MSTPLDCADCDNCGLAYVLRRRGLTHTPVCGGGHFPEKTRKMSPLAIVGQHPGKQDVAAGRPFAGPGGAELVEALSAAAIPRNAAALTNVVACRYPSDKKAVFDATLKRINRSRLKRGETPFLHPEQACAGRLHAEIGAASCVLALGSSALRALLPGAPKLSDFRGAPIGLDIEGTVVTDMSRPVHRKVLATWEPETVLRFPKWRNLFRNDIARAWRWFDGRLNWTEPKVLVGPSPERLVRILDAWRNVKATVAYDWETTIDDALDNEPRCLGLGTDRHAVVVPWVSIETGEPWYPEAEFKEIKELLRAFLTDASVLKIGQNSGYVDRIWTERFLGVTPTPHQDLILGHRLHNNEIPHGLGFIAAEWTDAPAWKSEHTATEAASDAELHHYCGRDCAITHQSFFPVMSSVYARKQNHLINQDHAMQDLCVGMKRLGMPFDRTRWSHHLEIQTTLRDKWADVLVKAQPGLNPNSHIQIRDLVFDKWGMPHQELTKGGEPSTRDASIRALIVSPLTTADQRQFLRTLRAYRRANKLLTTYLHPWIDSAAERGWGPRIHADYSAHGTSSGRCSSRGPNFQNVPYILRDIFQAPEGYRMVYADMDQLELRLAAAMAGATLYLDAFAGRSSIEAHGITGAAMFGDAYWSMPGAPKDRRKKGESGSRFAAARALAKRLCYSSLYGAGVPTVHSDLTSVEGADGDLVYAHYTIRQVAALHRRWLRNAPEFPQWWERTLQVWRKNGYIKDPVTMRRRDFSDGEDFNAIVNFPCQAGGWGVVSRGLLKLRERIPFNYKDGTGLIAQTHDSVVYLCREDAADEVAEIVQECLYTEALGVAFTAESVVQRGWAEIKE